MGMSPDFDISCVVVQNGDILGFIVTPMKKPPVLAAAWKFNRDEQDSGGLAAEEADENQAGTQEDGGRATIRNLRRLTAAP